MVFEILFQRDTASHDGGEFGTVHHVAAGVGGEVFFRDLFRNPANASDYAGKSCCVKDCFHKLVVRHDILKDYYFLIRFIGKLHTNEFHESSDTHHHHHNVLGNVHTRLL